MNLWYLQCVLPTNARMQCNYRKTSNKSLQSCLQQTIACDWTCWIAVAINEFRHMCFPCHPPLAVVDGPFDVRGLGRRVAELWSWRFQLTFRFNLQNHSALMIHVADWKTYVDLGKCGKHDIQYSLCHVSNRSPKKWRTHDTLPVSFGYQWHHGGMGWNGVPRIHVYT